MPHNNNEETKYKFLEANLSNIKAIGDDLAPRQFSGYLSVYGNVDSYGDIVQQGAFKQCLKDLKEKGKSVPILEMHEMYNQPIGYFIELKEDDYGLWVKGQLFSTSKGDNIHTIMKESPTGSVGMSIGYSIVKMTAVNKDAPGKADERGARWYLDELKLREGSIVYSIPANELAVVNDVKSQSMEKRKVEKDLKEKGLSAKDSAIAVSVFFEYLQEKNESEELRFGTPHKESEMINMNEDISALEKQLQGITDLFEKKEKETEENALAEQLAKINQSMEEAENLRKERAHQQKLQKLSNSLEKLLTE